MPDYHHRPGLPAEQLEAEQRQLWDELAELPRQRPSERLRREFYQRLSNQQRPSIWQRWFGWLRQPLVPAALTLVLGMWIGNLLTGDNGAQFDALQAQVETLNTTMALNLMQNATISDRLSGIEMAAGLRDERISRALLATAKQDESQSVRSAALAALGPQLTRKEVWVELQQLLTNTESPLVQLALADLIMRWGEAEQIDYLAAASRQAQLLPDVKDYVESKLTQEQI